MGVSCFFVGHKWSEWEYLDDKKHCLSRRICQRCGLKKVNSNHKWSDKHYVAGDSCVKIKTCQLCGKQNMTPYDTDHSWGDWVYETPESCVIYQRCDRCSQIKQKEIHDFSDWEYDEIAPCQIVKVRICHRCGKREREDTTTPNHQFGDWKYMGPKNCQQRIVCKNCGHVEYGRVITHDWGSKPKIMGIGSPGHCTTEISQCKRCGEEKRIETFHNWGAWKEDKKTGLHTRVCRQCGIPDRPRDFGTWLQDIEPPSELYTDTGLME